LSKCYPDLTFHARVEHASTCRRFFIEIFRCRPWRFERDKNSLNYRQCTGSKVGYQMISSNAERQNYQVLQNQSSHVAGWNIRFCLLYVERKDIIIVIVQFLRT
jgi:hypothetical protein